MYVRINDNVLTDLVMQNGATTTGNGVAMPVAGRAGMVMQVSGTFEATVVFEATQDEVNWIAILGQNMNTGGQVTSTTAPGLFAFAVNGLKSVRARISAIASGAVTVKGTMSPMPLAGLSSSLMKLTSRNVQLLANTTVTWDGTKTSDYVSVPVGPETACLIMIDNNGQSQNLTVTFEFEVSSGVWMQWFDGGGIEVSFVTNGDTRRVYGPFQGFPRYLQGRLKLTASTAPANTTTTVVQVQEVL